MGWAVVKDGTSNPKSKRPKQRYKCISPEGTRHTFTPPLPRDRQATTTVCYACGSTISAHQGPATLPGSGYQLIEVVQALLDVAAGKTYTEAALRVRDLYHGTGKSTGLQSGSTVANWVDRYAPILMKHYLPQVWCDGVALDSTEFQYTDSFTQERSQLFTILAAAGYKDDEKGKLWLLRAYPSDTADSWADFLSQLSGFPKWVVYDGDRAIKPAVFKSSVFLGHTTLLHYSEHHLYVNAKKNLKKDGHSGYKTETMLLLGEAFKTLKGWEAFKSHVKEKGLVNTTTWVDYWDTQVCDQLRNRKQVGKYSTGGVEPLLNIVKDELSRRSWTFRNLNRMNLLLGLISIRLNRQDNSYDWIQVLTRELEKRQGRSPHQYNRDTDAEGSLRKV